MQDGTTHWAIVGYPLLPLPYREAWADEPVPAALRASCGLPADSTLGILDGAVWEKVDDPRQLDGLIEHVARLFEQRVHRQPRSALAQAPITRQHWPEGLDARQLPFSLRTRNLLERAGRLDEPSWLASASAADLGALRLFGPLTVLEVAIVLERHVGSGNGHGTRAAIKPVLGTDDGAQPDVMVPLDVALTQLVRARVAERNVPRLLRRLGWDGHGGCSLQKAAEEFGVSRERIRQIEAVLLLRLHPNTPIPALDRATAVLEEAVQDGEVDGTDVLLRNRITARPFLPEGVMTAARIFDRTVAFEVTPDGRTIRQPVAVELVTAMVQAQLELGELNHVASVEEFCDRVRALGGRPTPAQARRFLDRRQRLVWLDPDRTWFWIRQPTGRNRLEQVIRKVLAVAAPITVDALGRALSRNPKVWPRPIPPHVLAGLCRAAGLVVDGRGVSSPTPLDPAQILSPSEYLLTSQLRDRCRPAHASELQACSGLAAGTLSTLLSRSPLVERVDDGVYRLLRTTI